MKVLDPEEPALTGFVVSTGLLVSAVLVVAHGFEPPVRLIVAASLAPQAIFSPTYLLTPTLPAGAIVNASSDASAVALKTSGRTTTARTMARTRRIRVRGDRGGRNPNSLSRTRYTRHAGIPLVVSVITGLPFSGSLDATAS